MNKQNTAIMDTGSKTKLLIFLNYLYMNKLNFLAAELNLIISDANPAVFAMLSEKGRAIYFPKTGILGQSAEAKSKRLNATIGMGLEDDGSPMRLNSLAKLVNLPPTDIFPYAPGYGKMELRDLWQKKIREKNPTLKKEISLPVVTNALTNGLSLAGYLFVDPGDRVILADRFWGTYRLIFENGFGGELSPFNTFKDNHFDSEALRTALAGGEAGTKKILLLNFPNNPSGYTPTEAEAKSIAEIIRKRATVGDKLVVLVDDAYFGLVYEEGIFQESLFALLADLHPNVLAVKIDGPTKEDYVWGLRVGFLTYGIKNGTPEIYQALSDKTAGAVRGNISNVSNLSQSLVFAALNSPNYPQEKQSKFELLRSRYRAVKKTLTNPKYADCFTPLPYNSGYFMCLKLAEGIDAEAVRKTLLQKFDTGVISLKDSLRLAFSSVAADKIPELIENIFEACLENKKFKN
jgi:aspartate/methionine/tyrosine aminotransferase